MTTHDKYDKKLLKGIEKIADRIDKIERKMSGEGDQTENINLSTLCGLAKENNCSMFIHIYTYLSRQSGIVRGGYFPNKVRPQDSRQRLFSRGYAGHI